MREILFRAKRVDNGEWEYGKLKSIHKGGANYETAYYILNCYGETRNGLARDAVDPETVCQFTGLLDKNGKKIFEGDVVKYEVDRNFYKKAEIVFKDCQFLCIDLSNKMVSQPAYMDYELEVIGNKFDNPELLKKMEE